MIKINLLPVRATRKQEAARRDLLIGGVGAFLVTALSFGLWIAMWGYQASVEAENTKLQAQIDQLAADVAKVDEMDKLNQELERKLKVIEDLRAQKVGPVHMLDDLATATPEKLQLTSLKENNGEVTIEGVSVSNDVISQFLRTLDATPSFEQVYLLDIEAQGGETGGVLLKKFKLTARLSAKAEEEKKEKKDGAPPAPPAPPAPGEGA